MRRKSFSLIRPPTLNVRFPPIADNHWLMDVPGMRRQKVPLVLVAFAALASPAEAGDYLGAITSNVYETTGSTHEIAVRAQRCIAQHLAGGTTESPVIVSSDLDGGMIVARNAMEYGGLVRFRIRSTFTFEAREGRFRITQTNLERFDDMFGGGWGPIGKWTGSQWKGAEDAFTGAASEVASCVLANKDDW